MLHIQQYVINPDINTVGSQLGVALERAQLFEAEQTRARRMAALKDIAELGASQMLTDQLARSISEVAASAFGAQRVLITLLVEGGTHPAPGWGALGGRWNPLQS